MNNMGNFFIVYFIVGMLTNLIWTYKIPTIRFETLLFMMFINPFIILFISIVELFQAIKKFYKIIDKKF